VGLVALIAFVTVATYLTVVGIDMMIGFRSSRASELIGLDFMEHRYDDGSFGTDPNKVTVISESVMRECLAQRMVRHLSPRKSYTANHSPSKTYEHNHSPSTAYEHVQLADNHPPNAPDESKVDSASEATAEPGAEHTLERTSDEPGTGQPSGAPAASAPSSTSEALGSGKLASQEELAREVAALRTTVAVLGEQVNILSAFAGSATRRPSQSSVLGGGMTDDMTRVASLRQLFSDAEREMAAAQTGRPNVGHASRGV